MTDSNNLHTYTTQEKYTYVNFINNALEQDQDMKDRGYMPIDKTTDQIFDNLKDGQLLAHLLHWCVPGSIDLNRLIAPRNGKVLNTFQLNENIKYVLKSMKDAGVNLINIGSGDIIDKKEHLVLAVLFAMLKKGLDRMLQDEMRKNREALIAMGLKFDDGVMSPEKILCDFYNDCLKKIKSPIVCRTTKDISNAKVISSAFYSYFPQMLPYKDLSSPIDLLSEKVMSIADKIGVPQSITASDLANGDGKLCFIFAAQTAVTIMQRPKLSEKFLVNFINKQANSKKPANTIFETVETNGLYDTLSKVMSIKNPEYKRDGDNFSKAQGIVYTISQTSLSQILDEDKLTDESQKEFIINFAFDLYCRSLTPFQKLQQWALKHTGNTVNLGDADLKNGNCVARILANISDNDGFCKQYSELSDNQKRGNALSTELQKLSIPFIYGPAQLVNNTETIQHIILHEIFQQYPFVLDKYTLAPEPLTVIINYMLASQKQKPIKNVSQDGQDMDKLAQIVKLLTGIDLSGVGEKTTSAEKADFILDVLEEKMGVEKCMKGQDLAMGGEKYVNSVITSIYQQKGINLNVLVEFLNMKYGANITAQSNEEKLFQSIKYFLSPLVHAKTIALINGAAQSFSESTNKIKTLVSICQNLGYSETFEGGCRQGAVQSVLEAQFCTIAPQDDFLLQEMQAVLQKKIVDFSDAAAINDIVQKTFASTAKDTLLIAEACQKMYSRQPSQLFLAQLKSYDNVIGRHFIHSVLLYRQKYLDVLKTAYKLQNDKFHKELQTEPSERASNIDAFLRTVNDEQLRDVFAHIFHDAPEKFASATAAAASVQQQLSTDKEWKLTSFQSVDEYVQSARIYQTCISCFASANKKAPFSLQQMVLHPEMVIQDIIHIAYQTTEKPDDFYISWANKLLTKCQYAQKMPTSVVQLGNGEVLSLLLSQSYPNEIKFDQFNGLDNAGQIQKAIEVAVANQLSQQLEKDDIVRGDHFIIKLFLKQIFIPMDPILERVYIPTYDLAFKILDNQLQGQENLTELQKLLVFLNQTSPHPKSQPDLLVQFDTPSKMAHHISEQVLNITGSNYCKPTLLVNNDANTMNAVVNDLVGLLLLPKQLLLKGVDDFVQLKSVEAFKHVLGTSETDPNKIFALTQQEFNKQSMIFPLQSADMIETTEEKFVQLLETFLYKQQLRPIESLEDYATKLLIKANHQSTTFNANKRGQKLSFKDSASFNVDILKALTSAQFPSTQKAIQQISGTDEDQVTQVLNVLQQNNVICTFIKPESIIFNNAAHIQLIINQMFSEIDLLGDKQVLSIEAIQQIIKTYCQHQYAGLRFKTDHKQFLEATHTTVESCDFTVQKISSPTNFVAVYRIFKNTILKLQNADQKAEFENLLQQVQDSKIQTQYVTVDDVIGCSSVSFRALMTDILVPSRDEEKLLAAEYNKYLKRAGVNEEITSLNDLDRNSYKEIIYAQMYPGKFNMQQVISLDDDARQKKINEFRVANGIPAELLVNERYKYLVAKLAHIPYDPLDDYVVYTANHLLQYSNIQLNANKSQLTQITPEDLLELARFMDSKVSATGDTPFAQLKSLCDNARIPAFYTESQISSKEEKMFVALISQIKLNMDYKFQQLQKIANNLFQVNGVSYRVSDKSDFKEPEFYKQIIQLINSEVGAQCQIASLTPEQQFEAIFKATEQLNCGIPLPIAVKSILTDQRLQRQLIKDLLLQVLPDTELIAYCNRLNERSNLELRVDSFAAFAKPLAIMSFLAGKYSDQFSKPSGDPSPKEVADTLTKNELFQVKVNEADMSRPQVSKIKLFLSEHFTPIDETSDKRKLPNSILIDFLKSRNIIVDNLGKDLQDGSQMIQLMREIDPLNFSQVSDYEGLCVTLKQVIPRINFLARKEAGNQRYNAAALTAIYETYMLSQQYELTDLIPWVNSCLKHQQKISNKMTTLKDLQDGSILAALLQVLQGDDTLFDAFRSQSQSNKQYVYLINKFKEHGVPDYIQESDFTEFNEYAAHQIISQLYCDTNEILDQIVSSQQLLLNWIQHKFIMKSVNDLNITAFNKISQNDLLRTTQTIYEYLQASDLSDYLDNLHSAGYCTKMQIGHLQTKYNYAAIWYLFDSIRLFEAIPKQHLINFINLKLKLKQPISNLGEDVSDGEALVRLLNLVCPDQCDLKPISIQNRADRAVAVCDYAGRAELGHLLTAKAILEGDEPQLHLFVEELYRKQQRTPEQYAEWVNIQIAKSRRTDLYLTSLQLTAVQMNCLFNRFFPDKVAAQAERSQISGLLEQPIETQIQFLLHYLQEQYKCDYISQDDIQNGTHRLNLMLDLIYRPPTDYSTAETLPRNFVAFKLRTANAEIASDEDALQPQNVMSEVYVLNPQIDLTKVYEQAQYDDQAELFVSTLNKQCPRIECMDGYDFTYDPNATLLLASEMVKINIKASEQQCLQFVNHMLWKINGGEKLLDALGELQDVDILLSIVEAAGLATPEEIQSADKYTTISTVLARTGMPYVLQESDLNNLDLLRALVEHIDQQIVADKHIDTQKLLNWANKIVVEDQVQEINELFQKQNLQRLSRLLCKAEKAVQLNLSEIDPNNPNCLELFMHQCQLLGIGKRVKIQELANNNAEAMQSLLTEIYGYDLPPETQLVGFMSELLKKAGLNQMQLNKMEDLQSAETLNAVISVMDPLQKKGIAKDPFAGLQKNIRNLGLNNYMQPEDLTQMDKMKVLIRSALQNRDENEQNDVVESVLLKAEKNKQLLLQKLLKKTDVKPISLADFRDTCALAKIMLAIQPSCFDSCILYEMCTSREQLKAWEFNKIINYNICVRVLQETFGIDLRGVSGRDLAQGDPKYLSSVMWRLSAYETARVEQRIGSLDAYLQALGVESIDWAGVNADFCAQLLNLLVPDIIAFKEDQTEQQKLQVCLDYSRSIGILTLYRPQDLMTGNQDVVRSYVAMVVELIAEVQNAGK